jgi:outer membrane protein W
MLQIGWEYSFPVSQLQARFIDSGTPVGIQGEFRTTLLTQLSAGVAVTWNKFEQTYTTGEEASYNAISVRGTLHYYFTRSSIQPYVGLGVGGVYQEALFSGGPGQTEFAFCADPQVGLLLTLDQGFAVNVLVRYEFTTGSFDVNGSPGWTVANPQWVAIQVGLAFY